MVVVITKDAILVFLTVRGKLLNYILWVVAMYSLDPKYMFRHQNFLPSQNTMEVIAETLERYVFGRHLGFPKNPKSVQPQGWFQCLLWKHMF